MRCALDNKRFLTAFNALASSEVESDALGKKLSSDEQTFGDIINLSTEEELGQFSFEEIFRIFSIYQKEDWLENIAEESEMLSVFASWQSRVSSLDLPSGYKRRRVL